VESYPPKTTFSEDHISAPKGCCAPKILYTLENDRLASAPLTGDVGPFYNFFSKGVKNWLKI